MTTKDQLIEAIKTGELLHIIYHGGSQPGSSRWIAPIKINDNKVLARCTTTNKATSFFIDKINLTGETNGKITYVKNKKTIEPANIKEAFLPHIKDLENQGWAIQLKTNSIGLYSRFKNSNLRKSPDIYCEYKKHTTYDAEINSNGEFHGIEMLSTRPFHVYSTRSKIAGSNFKLLSKACLRFLSYAKDESNNNN